MNQHSHADGGFVDTVAQALEEGVFVVETGVDFADGPEDTAFLCFGRVTPARAGGVSIEVILQASAETVV